MPRILRITPEMAGVPAAAPLARMGETPSAWPAIAKAATSLASTVETTGHQLIRIQGALQAEDAKLDAQEKFNKFKADVATRDAELRAQITMPEPGPVSSSDANGGVGEWRPDVPVLAGDGGEMAPGAGVLLPAPSGVPGPLGLSTAPAPAPPSFHPKDYYAAYGSELDKMADASAKSLKYPGYERQYRAQIATWVGAAKLDALNRGIKLQHEQIMVSDHLASVEEAHRAVYGATPEIRAAAVASREARLQRHLAGGLRDAQSVIAEKNKFQAMVEDGRIEKDWRYGDADTKNTLLGHLRAGRFRHLDPGAQQREADDLEHREKVAQEAIDKQTQARREEQAKEAEKMLVDFTAAGNREAARGVLAAARSILAPDAYRQWHERIAKGPVKETDAEVKRTLIPLVYNSSNNPREVDTALRAAYGQGLIADDDMKAWAGHLETRLNRQANLAIADQARRTADQTRAEGRLHREQADVEQLIDQMTRVDPLLAQSLDATARDAKIWALEDLHRNSPIYGGSERPMAWLNRNRATIMGRIGVVGQQRLRSIDQGLDFKTEQSVGPTEGAVKEGLRLLDANKNRMREDRYLDQLRLLKEKQALIREMPKWKAAPASATTPAPAAPARSGEPSLGGPVKAGR